MIQKSDEKIKTDLTDFAYNDLAEFYPYYGELIYGRAYTIKKGRLRLAKEGEYVVGIASDSYGFALGAKQGKKIPIALTGIVLAFVDKIYKEGTALKVGGKGILTKANWFDKIFRQELVVGYFFKKERKKKINDIVVNGRHWVKVK